MKLFSSLSKSTIITVIACACFLAMVGMILLFLMMFPIDPKKYSAEAPVETTQPVIEATTFPAATEYVDDSSSDPHLSTWEAVIDGETKSIDEHFWDSRPEYDPVDTEAATQAPNYESEYETEVPSEGVTDPLQTIPETVPEESVPTSDVTTPVETTNQGTLPVVGPPDPTEPPMVEPYPTEPPVVIPDVTDSPVEPDPAEFQ